MIPLRRLSDGLRDFHLSPRGRNGTLGPRHTSSSTEKLNLVHLASTFMSPSLAERMVDTTSQDVQVGSRLLDLEDILRLGDLEWSQDLNPGTGQIKVNTSTVITVAEG